MMTEEEAGRKWCPHARLEGCRDPVAGNRDEDGNPLGACFGSACMAWRWEFAPHLKKLEAVGVERGPKGYCGAFGRPE